MKSKKGFTLIELLAVIVILAIIALIATPIVLNLIDKARKGAAESSTYAYVKAAETAAVVKLMNSTTVNLANATCTVDSTTQTKLTCSDGDSTVLELDVKGDLPKAGGKVTFDQNGSVTAAIFRIGAYDVTYDSTGHATASAHTGE